MQLYSQVHTARHIGCSIKSIEKAIQSGRLRPAMLGNQIADLELATTIMRSNGHMNGEGEKLGNKRAPRDESLTEATVRKEQAILAAAERDALEMRGQFVEPEAVTTYQRKLIRSMGDVLMSHIDDIAALAGGRESASACVRHIREGVGRAMAAAAPRPQQTSPRPLPAGPAEPLPASASEALTRVRLRRQQCMAVVAEMKNAVDAGGLVRRDAVMADLAERMYAARNVLLNIHGTVLSPMTVAEVRLLLQKRFQEAIACWYGQHAITHAEPDEEILERRAKANSYHRPEKAAPVVVTATLSQLTQEFNQLVPTAQAHGIAWAKVHKSNFFDKALAVRQIERLRHDIALASG